MLVYLAVSDSWREALLLEHGCSRLQYPHQPNKGEYGDSLTRLTGWLQKPARVLVSSMDSPCSSLHPSLGTCSLSSSLVPLPILDNPFSPRHCLFPSLPSSLSSCHNMYYLRAPPTCHSPLSHLTLGPLIWHIPYYLPLPTMNACSVSQYTLLSPTPWFCSGYSPSLECRIILSTSYPFFLKASDQGFGSLQCPLLSVSSWKPFLVPFSSPLPFLEL